MSREGLGHFHGQPGASGDPLYAPMAEEDLLEGLWSACWFGVGSLDHSSSSSSINRLKSSAALADPLDNVIPIVSYAALGPSSADLSNGSMAQQQHPSVNGLQGAAVAGASQIGDLQLQLQQQQQQVMVMPQKHTSTKSAPAPVPGPSQPRPMRLMPGAAGGASPIDPQPYQQQQQQRQQYHQQHSIGQHLQPPAEQQQQPAPFVLGTWAQRQYILPVKKQQQGVHAEGSPAAADVAAAAAAAEAAGNATLTRGSSSPARPIPKGGKLPSSNGSSNSSGTSTRHKAAANGIHSSSGASSETPPAAAAAEAAAAAAEAEAAVAGTSGAAGNGDDAAAVSLWQQAAAAAGAGAPVENGGRRSVGTDEDEDDAVQRIAWRWRFARRWQAEQARGPQDPAAATVSPADGGMEEALQYLAACGENWHHLSRGSSHLGTVESRLLGTLGSPGGLGSELLADESFSAVGSGYGMQASCLLQGTADSGGALAATCSISREVSMTGDSSSDGQAAPQQAPPQQQQQGQGQQQQGEQQLPHQQQGQQQQQQGQTIGQLLQQQQQRRRQRGGVQPRGEATVQVTGITRRAQQLLEAQNDLSRAAQERWQAVSSSQGSALWAGALLEGVQVDPWGCFKFLLLRLRDRNGRQVLLVRGANNASEAKIVDELRKQMLAACTAHDLPAETIEVVGGGVMEWTQHRDRHLHLSCGYVSRGTGPGGPSTPSEVMRLAAVLTQQALPMHYRVTSDAG